MLLVFSLGLPDQVRAMHERPDGLYFRKQLGKRLRSRKGFCMMSHDNAAEARRSPGGRRR